MRPSKRLFLSLMFSLTIGTFNWGCESVALVGRPTLGPGAGIEEIELVAEVEGFDTREKEVYMRTEEGRTRVVAYTPDTRVIIEGREHPITVLRSGDLVAMQLHKDARGNDYANLIRVRERASEQARVGDKPQIEILEGTVGYVDYEGGFLELRPRSGKPAKVYLPYKPLRRTEERFRKVRVGDYVRIEGERISEDRILLLTFR